MMKRMIGYISKRPVLWTIGLLFPAVASFVMNYGLALGLEYYTAELSRADARFRNIVIIMAVTAFSVAAAAIIEDIARYVFSIFIIRTQNEIREDIYKSVVNTRYSLLSRAERGKLYTNYFTDTEMAAKLISEDIFAILFPVIHAIGYFAALFSADFVIGAMISGLTVSVLLLNLIFTNRFRRLEKATLTAKENFSKMTDAAVRGRITIRQLQIGDVIAGQTTERAEEIYRLGNANIRLNSCRKMTLELLSTICTSLMTPLACVMAASGLIELPSVVMIAQICRFIILQTSGLGIAVQQLGINMVACERIKTVLELPDEYENQENMERDLPLDYGKAAVTFEHFGVAYEEKVVLKEVSISIEKGKITAIIGPSGSGKTSLIHALMGLVEYSGKIRIFGVDARKIKLSELRKHIAYCPEHCQLFEDASIMDNLLHAAPDKNLDEMKQLLEELSLSDLDIEQKVSTLSGGQRQRIAFARALLKESEIIILDEPTASLDRESENAILRMLLELRARGKAVILISHRMSTVEIADEAFVLSDLGVGR